jgi:lysozyme
LPIRSAADLVIFHEGLKLIASPDAKGKWSIGRGRDIPAPPDPANPPTCTIAEADGWFYDEDLPRATASAVRIVNGLAWTPMLDPRRAVIIDMAYEIGAGGLAGFREFLMAVRTGDWSRAADEIVASLLYEQVPAREAMNVAIMRSGEWPDG